MKKEGKFTAEERYQIVLDILDGQLSHAEVCRRWNISSTYHYKLKDKALEVLQAGLQGSASQPVAKVQRLEKRVTDLEQLAGDQALIIRELKKKDR